MYLCTIWPNSYDASPCQDRKSSRLTFIFQICNYIVPILGNFSPSLAGISERVADPMSMDDIQSASAHMCK